MLSYHPVELCRWFIFSLVGYSHCRICSGSSCAITVIPGILIGIPGFVCTLGPAVIFYRPAEPTYPRNKSCRNSAFRRFLYRCNSCNCVYRCCCCRVCCFNGKLLKNTCPQSCLILHTNIVFHGSKRKVEFFMIPALVREAWSPPIHRRGSKAVFHSPILSGAVNPEVVEESQPLYLHL
ncbi:MAG: hypothetical protein JWQ40_4205 [Segetibacter sp.]|nr:hypothetical protein [Segetibacter sp.]